MPFGRRSGAPRSGEPGIHGHRTVQNPLSPCSWTPGSLASLGPRGDGLSVVVAAICLFTFVTTAAAAPAVPPPGAASCSGCHASDTKTETSVPRLAGRNAEDIVAAMAAFRAGQKPATVMDRIAKGFTDAEIRAIADWLGAQK